jgi:hypothetical protein
LSARRCDLGVTTNSLRSLPDADETKPRRRRGLIGIESDAAIRNGQLEHSARIRERDLRMMASAVLGDIGKALLRHAIQRHRNVTRHQRICCSAREVDANVQLMREIPTQHAQGVQQPALYERGGMQVRHPVDVVRD